MRYYIKSHRSPQAFTVHFSILSFIYDYLHILIAAWKQATVSASCKAAFKLQSFNFNLTIVKGEHSLVYLEVSLLRAVGVAITPNIH